MCVNRKSKKTNRIAPLRWFGGKSRLAKTIDDYTPAHQTYVEVFAGGAHIFWRKNPSNVEVLNDLDSSIVNFYRVLQDEELFERFQKMVAITPYSREIFLECGHKYKYEKHPVAKAWAFFVAYRQGRDGLPDGWSYEIGSSSRGMSATVSRWLSCIEGLPEIHHRLQGVQVENRHFEKIIERYDREKTWFYCDPPYVWSTREKGQYNCEMPDEEHLRLVDLLLDIKGMCLLSGYDNDIYKPLEVMGWKLKKETLIAPTSGKPRTECLWFSPNLLRALWSEGKCLDLRDE